LVALTGTIEDQGLVRGLGGSAPPALSSAPQLRGELGGPWTYRLTEGIRERGKR